MCAIRRGSINFTDSESQFFFFSFLRICFVLGLHITRTRKNVYSASISTFCIQMRDWRRDMGRDIGDPKRAVVGAGGEDAGTIAAYFDLHGLSSTTGLIVGKMDNVRTFQPNAFTSFWPSRTG